MTKMKFVAEREKRERDTLALWQESGVFYYSEKELKEAISTRLNTNTNYCFHDWLKDIVKIVSKRSGRRKCFCDVDGVIYFTSTGLDRIADYLIMHNLLKPEECE